jgi:hypothetical protein
MSFKYLLLSLIFTINGFCGFFPKEMSPESKECIECHREQSPSVYHQWRQGRHSQSNVGCYECHVAEKADKDGYDHNGQRIAVIVTPKDCAKCHEQQVEQFMRSQHSQAANIENTTEFKAMKALMDNKNLSGNDVQDANVVQTTGCYQCHGSTVKVNKDGQPDTTTWPNTGVGRVNMDGSKGSCTACHQRHVFSTFQARQPETCAKCHRGSEHPQMEVFEESKHGIAYKTFKNKMNMDHAKWKLGEDYWLAPTCATCHIGSTHGLENTHNISRRVTWDHKPPISRPTPEADKEAGLSSHRITVKKRKKEMQKICQNCHSEFFIKKHYVQYEANLNMYHDKFAKPAKSIYELIRPQIKEDDFKHKLDLIYYQLWHNDGRSLRAGAAMMGANHIYQHGALNLGKRFYHEFLPEVDRVIETIQAKDAKQAEDLKTKIKDILAGKKEEPKQMFNLPSHMPANLFEMLQGK